MFRIENVLECIQARQPVLSHAEIRMKQELQQMAQNIKMFQKSFDQVRKYNRGKFRAIFRDTKHYSPT